MGCGSSSPVAPRRLFVLDERKPGQGAAAARDFARLKLDKPTVDALFDIFSRVDVTNSGYVDLEEFYRFFKIERSAYADRVFSILDSDGSGAVDFREFVISIWNFCSQDLRALLRFSFTLFDPNGSGYISKDDLKLLVEEVYGTHWEANPRLVMMMAEADAHDTGRISFEEFRELNRKFPSMMFPAFTLQETIRQAVLGKPFWEKQYKERSKMGATAQYSVWDVLQAVQDATGTGYNTELQQLKDKRWMPAQHKEGDYVPEISDDPVSKAAMRRREVYGGPRDHVPEEERLASQGIEAGSKAAKRKKDELDAGTEGDLGIIREVSRTKENIDSATQRKLVRGANAGAVDGRRASISGGATAAERRGSALTGGGGGNLTTSQLQEMTQQRRGSVTTGVVGGSSQRRGSLVGSSGTRVDDIHAQPARSRRRSSLVNAQERAAAMAMMHT